MSTRHLVRAPQIGDIRAIEAAEQECFSDPWPGHYFINEMRAAGRFQRIIESESGELQAYLFATWQYVDLHVLKVATRPCHQRNGLACNICQ